MSKILKRPMFRGGGRANSRGTGIMTGIEDREPFQLGGPPSMSIPRQEPKFLDPLGEFVENLFTIQPGSALAESQKRNLLEELSAGIPEKTDVPAPKEETFLPIQTEGGGGGTAESSAETSEGPIVITETPKGSVEDVDDITLDDFEADISRKAELYEKMLAGPEARKQSIYRALTAASPELMKGEYGEAIKAASDELASTADISQKAKLLAIQEKIERDAQVVKTPTKSQEVADLIARGLSEEAAINKVYGSEKSQYLPPYSPQREIQQLTEIFAKMDDDHINRNSSGYAFAEIYKRQGIPTITYERYYDEKTQQGGYRPTITPEKMETGQIYFDPESFKFFYKDESAETGIGSAFTIEEARSAVQDD